MVCHNAESQQPFDETKHRHTLNEVDDVAEGKYDWKIERSRWNQHMTVNHDSLKWNLLS